jgi:hypothetical protein
MLIAYVDESYQGDLYCIGAAIAEQSVWDTVEDGLEKLRRLNNDLHRTTLDGHLARDLNVLARTARAGQSHLYLWIDVDPIMLGRITSCRWPAAPVSNVRKRR